MSQSTISKEELQHQLTIDTNYTKALLVKEVNLSGLVSASLETLFGILSHSTQFIEESSDGKQLHSFAQYIVDTSPYHKEESVNVITLSLKTLDDQIIGQPVMRCVHKESAEIISAFVNNFGSPQSLVASDLTERANQEEMAEHLYNFIETLTDANSVPDPEHMYSALGEYIITSIITGNYDSFDISPEDFVQRINHSLADVDNHKPTPPTPPTSPPKLRVIK